ncbi:MAG: ImmA/IrrE family metallo-endopeptidase [Bacteroidetes bacterium]|nr:ImmA/IrrE family metallo-endopeptidase [Bacteroidota bacterium]
MINPFIENKTGKILQDAGLYSHPINVVACAEYFSIKIDYLLLEDGISGFFVKKDSEMRIAINSEHNILRQRFTIAHELGHYVLHRNEESLFIDKGEKVMYRDLKSTSGEYRREREANAFAAALLMPEDLIDKEVRLYLNDNQHVYNIVDYLAAEKFHVSSQAMAFRLSNLGYELGMF